MFFYIITQNRTEHIFIDIKLRPLTGSVRATHSGWNLALIFMKERVKTRCVSLISTGVKMKQFKSVNIIWHV